MAAADRAWDRSELQSILCRFFPAMPSFARAAIMLLARSAPRLGSASILLISYAYIAMMGADGLTRASEVAILNANYIKTRLEKHFPTLYERHS